MQLLFLLLICEDIKTATDIYGSILGHKNNTHVHLYIEDYDCLRSQKTFVLEQGDVVITTNLGSRGTDFTPDNTVNQNGGLFVLVTFLPANDRVQKQAFGRTGRRGATGSCQIIVNRDSMPTYLRQCETIEEAKRLRDCIVVQGLIDLTGVNMMRVKQKLFKKYCELKRGFVNSCHSESDDFENTSGDTRRNMGQSGFRNYESMTKVKNYDEMVAELSEIIRVSSDRAKKLQSDNIYHLLNFGAIRLTRSDYVGAKRFYDQVVCMDPVWSLFSHYNRAYCTLNMKNDGYIQSAIVDLKSALSKLEAYRAEVLSSYIFSATAIQEWDINQTADLNILSKHVMIECNWLHNLGTQIVGTIELLEKFETTNEEVTTERRNVLHFLSDTEGMSEKMLVEYSQLGLLFIYTVNDEPIFHYNLQIVYLLGVLEAVSYSILKDSVEWNA